MRAEQSCGLVRRHSVTLVLAITCATLLLVIGCDTRSPTNQERPRATLVYQSGETSAEAALPTVARNLAQLLSSGSAKTPFVPRPTPRETNAKRSGSGNCGRSSSLTPVPSGLRSLAPPRWSRLFGNFRRRSSCISTGGNARSGKRGNCPVVSWLATGTRDRERETRCKVS